MGRKLPDAKDWRARELENWTSTTFRSYLMEKHEERYNLPYTSYSIAQENTFLKRMATEHGKDVLKEFIDACLVEYKPNPRYPSVNFGFMYSHMRSYLLPRVIKKVKDAERLKSLESTEITQADIDYL